MSERGSFVTEWMYCDRCFRCVKEVLEQSEKHLTGIAIPWPHDNNLEMPIVAGRIGGLYQGEEIDAMKELITDQLEPILCHAVRIAVLSEQDEVILVANPSRPRTN